MIEPGAPLPTGVIVGNVTRWIDIRDGELDEAQMATCMKQAAAPPRWVP